MQTSWELFDQDDDVRVMIIMKCNFYVYVSREISKTISKYLNSNIMEITDLLKEPKGNAKNGRNMWVLQNCLKNLFSFNIEEVTNLLLLPQFLAVAAKTVEFVRIRLSLIWDFQTVFEYFLAQILRKLQIHCCCEQCGTATVEAGENSKKILMILGVQPTFEERFPKLSLKFF